MSGNLREYVESLFADAPKTQKVYDLKEEMIANLTEKQKDLVASGKTPEEAFNIVISGIGDVDELIASLGSGMLDPLERQRQRRRSAVVVSVAVMLYILSIVSVILCSDLFDLPDSVSASIMFLIAGIATAMLVYHYMTRPKYERQDDSMVEEFKEWRASNDKLESLRRSVTSVMWTLIVALYFIISFLFGIWYISWIIFLIGAAFDRIIRAYFDLSASRSSAAGQENGAAGEPGEWRPSGDRLRSLRRSATSVLWLLIVVLYFVISFAFRIWYVSWVIFLIGAALDRVIKAYFDYKQP